MLLESIWTALFIIGAIACMAVSLYAMDHDGPSWDEPPRCITWGMIGVALGFTAGRLSEDFLAIPAFARISGFVPQQGTDIYRLTVGALCLLAIFIYFGLLYLAGYGALQLWLHRGERAAVFAAHGDH